MTEQHSVWRVILSRKKAEIIIDTEVENAQDKILRLKKFTQELVDVIECKHSRREPYKN